MAVTVNVSPFGPKPQFVDWITGAVANGYQVFFYVAGSVNTKQTTFTDSTGTVANTNPLILDTAGQPNNVQIWFQQGLAYKVLIATPTDSDPPTNGFVLGDFLRGINDGSATAVTSEWIAGPAPAFISGTQFSMSGDQTSNFQVNRRVQTTNSGGTVYGVITASVFAAGITTVTIAPEPGSALDSGLSAVNYGLLSALHPSIPFPVPYSLPNNSICEGRLTLTTGVPVTTSDVTAATTLLFTPYGGATVSTYNGSYWTANKFTEKSVAVPATTSTPFDVFLVDGTLALETVNWTNDTTRATPLVTQDGVLVKSGVTTRRYLGTGRTTTVSGQCEDSVAKRYLWNYYNRVLRSMKVADASTGWTYNGGLRQADANAANQLDCVIGVAEALVSARVESTGGPTASGNTGSVGIGINSTTVDSSLSRTAMTATLASALIAPMMATYLGYPAIGRNTIVWLEQTTTGSVTFIGTAAAGNIVSAITGQIMA